MKKKVLFAADHAGFDMKAVLVPFVAELGYETEDFGAHECDEVDDYPDYISYVAKEVSEHPDACCGIVLGGSGQGEAIVANRFPRVRAVVFNGQFAPDDGRVVPDEIVLAREHNNANILSLGARFVNEEEAKEAVKKWLTTEFFGEERHARRITKIDDYPR